jgi:LacI family transcriptional regulator
VISDGFGGALNATRHLFGLGHRRIGFFLAESHVITFHDRLRGFLCAHFHAGLTPPDPAWIVSGTATKEQTAALRSLLDAPAESRPTALVTANDHYAVMALRICREMGLKVPGDLSIVGFDDTPFSQETDPPLTTVRVDKEMLGRLAVRQLHLRLRSDTSADSPASGVGHELPVSLIVRESCRAL